MQQLRFLALAVALALGSGCPSQIRAEPPDAEVPDAEVPDDPPPSSPPAALVLSAGGTVTTGSFSLDVQIGEPLVPRPVSTGDTNLAPHGAIQP